MKALLPPIFLTLFRFFRQALGKEPATLTFMAEGQEPPPHSRESGYDSLRLIALERRERGPLIRRLSRGLPLTIEPTVTDDPRDLLNSYMTFGYVLALAARRKDSLRILDYGGCLGEYYWIGRTLLPNVELDYHCKELPAMADEGAKLNPAVVWHRDDSCLFGSYDLVMFSGSLQYLTDWRYTLGRAADCTGAYLFLANIPALFRSPTYLALQRLENTSLFPWQLNREEVFEFARDKGLFLASEFDMGEHPLIARAPEQPVYRGWLFGRGAPA